MTVHRIVLAATLLLLAVPAGAQDVLLGENLARRWCSSCHLVTGDAAMARADGVPSFRGLAARPDVSPVMLRRAMTAQHSRMPDFNLGTRDQEDLIAYIMSLKPVR
jgi:mono/diheme cytochrome c family protein